MRIATGRLVFAGLGHVLATLVMELETERNAQLQHQAPPYRGITELAPSCPDLGSCRSLLEIFNAPLRSKVKALSWLVFSNASNLYS